MRGSTELMQRMCHRLWAEPGKVTEDGLLSVGHASFLGLSDQGPSLLVNGRPVARLDAQRIDTLCGLILARRPLDEWPAELFAVQANIRRRGPLLADPLQPGDAIRAAFARADASGNVAQPVLDEIKRANLRDAAARDSPPG